MLVGRGGHQSLATKSPSLHNVVAFNFQHKTRGSQLSVAVIKLLSRCQVATDHLLSCPVRFIKVVSDLLFDHYNVGFQHTTIFRFTK